MGVLLIPFNKTYPVMLGKNKHLSHIIEGLGAAINCLNLFFAGENNGKLIVLALESLVFIEEGTYRLCKNNRCAPWVTMTTILVKLKDSGID
jgi:hypothetical protein